MYRSTFEEHLFLRKFIVDLNINKDKEDVLA